MESVIRTAIAETAEELGFGEVDFSVEHPSDFTHGDYASNVAMVLAREAGKSPREIAEQFLAALEGQIEYVEKIEIAGPGFINFFLAREFFTEELTRALTLGNRWGGNDTEAGEHVLIEYTSPNLFKPLHVGNLVGNIVGESIARLFTANGAEVERINYPSDIGLTVAKGVWGLTKTGGNPEDIAALGEAYRAGNEAYENDPTAKEEIETVNRSLYAGDSEELNTLRAKGISTSKARLAELCRMLGTEFNLEIFESEASPLGTALVREHIQDGIFEESDDAIIFAGEKHGLHTRVFLNSQGLPTYEAKDLGNFALKQKQYPEWTKSVVVTGSEQREYFKVIIAAIREVFTEAQEKDLEHIATGFLTLNTGKMSSRKGNVLTGESMLEEMETAAKERAVESRAEDVEALAEMIAVAALKYQILRQSLGSDIIFDKERALSFEGDSGPYLQYTYARINSLLEKAAGVGVAADIKNPPETPYTVEKVIYQFPEVIEQALLDRAPHQVVTYLTELAGSFNSFYAEEKIADENDEFAPYKAAVAAVVGQTLANGLWVLGIKAPEKM
ncbi:arginine--tRNA ligase [Candidatus Parcubacteria bacterium]|uniref:Arginine--tRNA ligase n=1 Tax=Candidatus Kaiserbacteria bacterium CG10_big_fil_rev_8_21_14_0_10_47_16 TaxID=1974608 RepID=A0A2H0UEL1_9BACT|nr:arginine--tRNA ligase [Candidatus Parcubacteria bacterium]PIR84849.1 MAG: arginine--tRNA ligase [Candidatus Kaiserbacteria bacterium CG10_big_fil_rev_8_21_14_0_10_47_16]